MRVSPLSGLSVVLTHQLPVTHHFSLSIFRIYSSSYIRHGEFGFSKPDPNLKSERRARLDENNI